jgi:hypothetical protein
MAGFSQSEGALHEKARYTDSQIKDAFKRVEAGIAAPDLCRELVASVLPRSTSGAPNMTALTRQ